MEVQIYFDILSNDLATINVVAKATLSGSYRPATFHHETEDDRECYVDYMTLIDNDGEEFEPSSKLINLVHEHIDDKDRDIYNKATNKESEIYIDDFKSDHDYATLMF